MQSYEPVPQYYVSRKSNFKEKLQSDLNGIYMFIRPLNQEVSSRETLLVPTNFGPSLIVSDVLSEASSSYTSDPCDKAKDDVLSDVLRQTVHTALRLRQEILKQEKRRA
jgi:hypothetical protein